MRVGRGGPDRNHFPALPQKDNGNRTGLHPLLLIFTTCHTFEKISYMALSLDKQIFTQVCG